MSPATDVEPPPIPLLPGLLSPFPDPRIFNDDGLVAFGGDLEPERLLLAYRSGIFPWSSEGEPLLWWSPNPRGVLRTNELHVSRRLERTLRQADFELAWNRAFRDTMVACGESRSDGTWITDGMLDAYEVLHEQGHAHSLEVWREGRLVAGTYGVQVGGLFAAESKFHRERDLSKVALVSLARALGEAGIELIDVQFQTEHLAQFGVVEITRDAYVAEVARLRDREVDLSSPLRGSSP